MKVKRFKNLWTMGLILCAVILISIYVLKIFFPNIVVEVAEIKPITVIGHYIDNHKWAWYIVSSIISFITYYLICCACCGKRKLNLKENIIVIVVIALFYGVKEILPQYYTALNYVSMILLPCLFKGKFINTTIVFSSLILLQVLTLEIRNIITYVADFNYATLMILMIDYYVVQVLFYFAFNFKNNKEKEGE